MKYLFTYTFKTVQNTLVHLRHIDEALKKGKSSLLIRSLSNLQDSLPLLENIQAPTHSETQAKQATELCSLISSLILLPEDMELTIKEIEAKCHTFIKEIDPFRIETLESTGIRKARLIEELMIVQDRVEVLIENFQSRQVSPVVLCALIEEKIDEMSYIDQTDFSSEETAEYEKFIKLWEELNQFPTEKGAMNLLTIAIGLENLLRNQMTYKDALEILDQGLTESFRIVEVEGDSGFLEIIGGEQMKDAMFLLSKYAFSDKSINFSLDELFREYQNLLEDQEEGNSNLEEIFLHLKTFGHHLDTIRERLASMEGSIKIDETPFLDDDDED